ncbi:MAG: hypothetical protein EBQ92_06900 [Proteobacteria bacterium]|nr:hypothetical protein [Pseudomonadota bacterium]
MKNAIYILVLFFSLSSKASLLRPSYEFSRATGMGNAFIALADDATSIFYNPAALAKNKTFHLHILDTQLLVDGIDSLDRIKNAVFDGKTDKLINPNKQSLGLGIKPTLITPYFGLSVYSQGFGFFELNSLQGSNIDVFAYNDVGIALAFGIPFSDYFSFGFGIRAVQRSSIEVNKTVSELLAELGMNSATVNNDPWTALQRYTGVGYGFPLNAGFLLTLPQVTKSSPMIRFAGTVENIGGTSFQKVSGASAPSQLAPSYHFGSLLQYTLNKDSVLNITTDFKDQFQGILFLKTLHLGVEFHNKYFGLRAGLSEGYATYGFSLEFPPHTKLHFSSYAKELGEKLWEKQERFYQVQLIVGFNPW